MMSRMIEMERLRAMLLLAAILVALVLAAVLMTGCATGPRLNVVPPLTADGVWHVSADAAWTEEVLRKQAGGLPEGGVEGRVFYSGERYVLEFVVREEP
jgi:hypothetical protein